MKICWDNLEKLRYSKKTDKWRLNKRYYVYKNSCEICNNPYLSEFGKDTSFCSNECKSTEKINSLIGKRFGKLIVEKLMDRNKHGQLVWACKCDCGNFKIITGNNLINKHTLSCGCLNIEKIKKSNSGKKSHLWKGGVTKKNIPLYDTYAHQINYVEEVRRNKEDENILEVKCKKCNGWFIPRRTEIQSRIESLNGNKAGEHNLYCSQECKGLCHVFHKQNYQSNHPHNDDIERPYQQGWSKIVIENANSECEICGSKENLVAHHILPVKTYPYLQADIDNGICLCEECHYKYGHKDECSTGNLARMVC